MWYRSNHEGYICGSYAKHGRTACTNHVIKESELIGIILADLKKMNNNLNHPDMISKAETKAKSAEKKSKVRLQSIEKQMEQ